MNRDIPAPRPWPQLGEYVTCHFITRGYSFDMRIPVKGNEDKQVGIWCLRALDGARVETK